MSVKNKTIEELAAYLKVDLKRAQSICFWVVDFLMDDVPQNAVDAGMYHLPAYVGDKRAVEVYQAILWGSYEEKVEGNKAEAQGPWVTIDPVNGVGIHNERPRYVI